VAPVHFVCDLCGTPGRAPAPGPAQCETCGWVALAEAPASDPSAPEQAAAPHDPFALNRRILPLDPQESTPGPEGHARSDAAEREPPRLALLWTPPGRSGGETPLPTDFRAVRPEQRGRRTRGALAPLAALTATAALAIGGAAFFMAPRQPLEDGRAATSADAPAPPPAPAARATAPDARPRPDAPQATAPARPPAPRTPRVAAASPGPASAPAERSGGVTAAVRSMARNPAPEDRMCVPRALRARKDIAERIPPEITARFPVAASGAVGRIDVVGLEDRDVADAVEDAIRGCAFVPGADDEGRPTPLSVVMRIRFGVR
jgi:protein TonB